MTKFCLNCEKVTEHTNREICIKCGFTSWQLDVQELKGKMGNKLSYVALISVWSFLALAVGLYILFGNL